MFVAYIGKKDNKHNYSLQITEGDRNTVIELNENVLKYKDKEKKLKNYTLAARYLRIIRRQFVKHPTQYERNLEILDDLFK